MCKKKKGIFCTAEVMLAIIFLSGCNHSMLSPQMYETNGEARAQTTENRVERESAKENVYQVATVRWADWGEAYHEGFPDEAAKEVGIAINWDTIVYADWGSRKMVVLAGGALPDAFMGSICFDETDILTNIGTFIALDDYIDEYMPNFKNILESDPIMQALATSSDGHIYGLPSKKPCRPTVANQMFINQTWLDNLGLDMPTTYEEFVNVLRAFKEQDANGNGDPNDEIPFAEGFADTAMHFCIPFGVTPGGEGTYSMTVKDGEAVFIPTSEEYKTGIAAMHECYAEGLIDPEIFVQDDSMRDAKLMSETPIVGCAAGWTADAIFGANADQYVVMPPLIGPDGTQYVASDPGHWNYSRYEFMVTSFCENPGELLAWVDKFYTEDASIQNFYGSFGVGVEKNEATGNYTVLEAKGMSADSFAWSHSLRDFGPKYVPDGFEEKVTYAGYNGDASKLELDKNVKQYAAEAYPNVSYTVEQLEKLYDMNWDITTYVNVKQAAWVTEGGIEEQWDEYIETLKQMGYDEFIQIQKEAFTVYRGKQ